MSEQQQKPENIQGQQTKAGCNYGAITAECEVENAEVIQD